MLPEFLTTGSVLTSYTGKDKIIHIPEGIITIGIRAFENNKELEEVYCPSTLEYIAPYAFHKCSSLKKVYLNKGLGNIGTSAFKSSGIEEIVLPDTVTFLGKKAFFNCHSLKKVTLSKNLREIPPFCFMRSEIEEISVPEGITSIGASAFEECKCLKKATLPNTLLLFGEGDEYNGYVFENCIELKSVNIPENIHKLYTQNFSGCVKLEEINFQTKRLDFIEEGNFWNCIALNKIVLPTCYEMDYNIFNRDDLETKIYCDKETCKFCPEFVESFGPNIVFINSLESLLENNKSFKEINNILLKENQER